MELRSFSFKNKDLSMLIHRRAQARGHANFGWLDSWHSFSFGSYYDPAHMGFSDLRVINQDVVAPKAGFGMHGHQDMEILTYVISGQVAHEDSLGNRQIIGAGEIQRMSAGRGIQHSEFNPSDTHSVEFLQIWILPATRGIEPGYAQAPYSQNKDAWTRIAHPANGALHSQANTKNEVALNQDANVYRGVFAAGKNIPLIVGAARKGWLQVIKGSLAIEDLTLGAGDGLAIIPTQGDKVLHVHNTSTEDAELLLFDLRA
jgi:redox-sensitive bicupin YhaK (pirin superfamily)